MWNQQNLLGSYKDFIGWMGSSSHGRLWGRLFSNSIEDKGLWTLILLGEYKWGLVYYWEGGDGSKDYLGMIAWIVWMVS